MNCFLGLLFVVVAVPELACGQQQGQVDKSQQVGQFPFFSYGYPQFAFPVPVPVPVPATGETGAEMMKRDGNNNNAGLWFGPRLGRKKRSLGPVDVPHESGVDTRTLVKILHSFNWAIVPVKERRTFTPRLGRSGPAEEGQTYYRSQPFSPRLGRSQADLFDIDEEKRGQDGNPPPSQDDKNGSTGAPFSPRLGRSDHFSPRLGRSGSFDE